MAGRGKLAALLLILTAGVATARLPASWVDVALNHVSEGRLRLAQPSGSVWTGQGHLAVTRDHGGLQALQAIAWRIQLQPWPLRLQLALMQDAQPVGVFSLGASGFEVNQLAYELPLPLISAAVPHPAARVGWRGSLALQSTGLSCNWQGQCEGVAQATWHDAGLDIVPEQSFGSHRGEIRAVGEQFALTLATQEGAFKVQGQGQVDIRGMGYFKGEIRGEPDLVDRIPNVMSRNAQRTATPGHVRFEFP